MATYQIENTHSGVVLGEFCADSEAEALHDMALEAGYSSYDECCAAAPVSEGEILVTKIAN